MKKSNIISKAKIQKQPEVAQKKVTKSVLVPPNGNLKNPLQIESKKRFQEKNVDKDR